MLHINNPCNLVCGVIAERRLKPSKTHPSYENVQSAANPHRTSFQPHYTHSQNPQTSSWKSSPSTRSVLPVSLVDTFRQRIPHAPDNVRLVTSVCTPTMMRRGTGLLGSADTLPGGGGIPGFQIYDEACMCVRWILNSR
jgi:hypothetical protein